MHASSPVRRVSPSSLPVSAWLPVVALTTVACSANVAAPADMADADVGTSSYAVVVVERETGPNDAVRAEAVARFVRMRQGTVDEGALRMAGVVVDFPVLGSCTPPGGTPRLAAPTPFVARGLELVDVGPVTVEANGVATPLVPRRVPDVADLLSGVVYTRSADVETLPPHAHYLVRATGAGGPEALTFTGMAPAELEVHSMATAAGVELSWEPGNVEDVVYVDVVARGPGTGSVVPPLRCLFADGAGRGLVPSPAVDLQDEGVLEVHRLHREVLRVRGLEQGEVRFDFARVVPLHRR